MTSVRAFTPAAIWHKNHQDERLAFVKEQEDTGKPAPVICRRMVGAGCSVLDPEAITIDPDGPDGHDPPPP